MLHASHEVQLLLTRCSCNCRAFVYRLVHLAAVVEMLLKLIEGSTSTSAPVTGRRVPVGRIATSRHNKVTSSLWCLSPKFFMSRIRGHVYIDHRLTICQSEIFSNKMHKISVEECAFKVQSVRVLKDWTIQASVCMCFTCDHTDLKFHGFVFGLCNANMVCFLQELNF
jgi:hypothetical protein